MAMLLAEKPHLPTAGVNLDAKGLTAREEEAADLLNFRVTPEGLITRAGDQQLASVAPGGDPIIHQHLYKAPDGEEILFGFTKDDIWRYSKSQGGWESCLEALVINNCDALTGWATSENLELGGFALAEGADCLFVYTDTGSSEVTLTLDTALDISGYSHFRFALMFLSFLSSNLYSFTVTFKDSSNATIDSFTILAANVATELTRLIDSSRIFISHELTATPGGAGWSDLKSISIDPYVEVPNVAFYYIDYLHVYNPLVSDVTFWSTTDFLDVEEGLTVIAAASSPVNPGQEEGDVLKRKLFYYDTDDFIFKPLVTKERVTITNESLGTTAAASTTRTGGPLGYAPLGANADANWVSLVGEALVSFYTLELGLIGTASAVLTGSGATAKYPIVPANQTILKGGANSWIEKDGSNWSLQFQSSIGDWAGLDIYVEYTYFSTLDFKPRFVAAFHNYLILASTYEDLRYQPWRFRWSQVARKDEFNTLDYQDTTTIDPTPIVALEYQSFYLMLIKHYSIIRVFHVQGEIPQAFQDTDVAFNYQTMRQMGTFAGRTIQEYEGLLYFMGHDDAYAFDGNQAFSITRNNQEGYYRVRDDLFKRIDQQQVNNYLGFINQTHKEYWLGVVLPGETYPTRWYIYNILLDIWYIYEYPAVTSIGEYRKEPTSDTIADLIGTIGEQRWTFQSASFTGLLRNPTLAYEDGSVRLIDESLTTTGGYTDPLTDNWITGSEIPCYLITRDFVYDNLHRVDRTTRVKFEATGDSVEVRCSTEYDTEQAAMDQPQIITMGQRDEYNYDPDYVGRHIRFGFFFDAFAQIRWIQPYGVPTSLYHE